MMHNTLTCDHPQCHGLTNFLTENEQLRVDFKIGDKVRVGIIQLGSYVKKLRNAHLQYEKRKNNYRIYYKKHKVKLNEKSRRWYKNRLLTVNRNRAFAYTWTLQIRWLLN